VPSIWVIEHRPHEAWTSAWAGISDLPLDNRTARETTLSDRVRANATASGGLPTTIEVPWTRTKASHTHALPPPDRKPDQKLLQAVVRAHAWLAELKSERFSSIEELASTTKLHPKVVRQALRLAFLSPELTSAILEGDQPGLTLRGIPERLPLHWNSHP